VFYSGGERAEKGATIVVHKSVVRSDVKIIYNDRIVANSNLPLYPTIILWTDLDVASDSVHLYPLSVFTFWLFLSCLIYSCRG
jgi:hypothetical protein